MSPNRVTLALSDVAKSQLFAFCDGRIEALPDRFEEDLYVPAHEVGKNKSMDPSIVTVRAIGGKLRAVKADGGLESIVRILAEHGVSVSLSAIRDELLDPSSHPFEKTLYLIVRRAIDYAEEINGDGREIEAMKKDATISKEEFSLENKSGIAYLHKRGYEFADGTKDHLRILIERLKDGIDGPLKVVKVFPPSRAAHFVAQMNDYVTPETRRGIPFANLGELGKFLRVNHSAISGSKKKNRQRSNMEDVERHFLGAAGEAN